MLNICLVSYDFPPMISGEGTHTFGLAKALSNSGHDVTVITTDLKGGKPLEENYFKIIRVSPIKIPALKLFYFDILSKKKIKELHDRQNIDIIHYTQDYYKISISKEKINVPIIATMHTPWAIEREIIKAKTNRFDYLSYIFHRNTYFLKRMNKKACERADKLIAVSKYVKRTITKEYGITSDKVEVIPNAVDINKFSPNVDKDKVRKMWNFTSEPIVLFVGRLDHTKGIMYLVKSFSKIVKDIPDAKLIIIGKGQLRNHIISFIDKNNLGKSIILIRSVEDEDLPKFYAFSDLVVLPSLMEGFGIVLIEAMACGKPCIVTRAGGPEDIVIDGETGFIVPPADSYSLCQAIHALLTNDNLAKDFGRAGRKRVERNFTWDKIAKETVDVYKEML
jgi:glycosyltransferase involved in cell wall biosynthesis